MQLNTHALLLLSRKSTPDSCSWQHMEGYWLTLVQDLVMRVGFSLGLFQKELCPLGALRYPLGRPQNKHTFNNYLNYLSLTVWAPNNEDWTWLSCFGRHTDSGTHETKCWVLTIITFKMRGVAMRHYLCSLACKSWWEHCMLAIPHPTRSSMVAWSGRKWMRAHLVVDVWETETSFLTILAVFQSKT